jgi:hypothetical protein
VGLRCHPGPVSFIRAVRMRLYGLGIASLGRSVSTFCGVFFFIGFDSIFQFLIDLCLVAGSL